MPRPEERCLRAVAPSGSKRKAKPTQLKKRAPRAERRLEKYEPLPPGSAASGQSLLESQSVTKPVRDDYLRRCRLFICWASLLDLDLSHYSSLELAILEYFDEMFFDGRSAEDGEKLWASLKFFDPGLGRRGDHLFPRVLRALKGWHRLCPAMTRPLLSFFSSRCTFAPANCASSVSGRWSRP